MTSIQDRIGNIFGPLSQVWEFLEIQKDQAIEAVSNLPDEEKTDENLKFARTAKDCSRLLDMSVTMLGQAFNSISYYRRRNALMNVLGGDKAKVKDVMKENKEILEDNSSQRLFGEKFDTKIMGFVKLKKNSRNFLTLWKVKPNK